MTVSICIGCGVDHSNQVTDYPLGTTLELIQSLTGANYMVKVGDTGKVIGHCNDGRAMIKMDSTGKIHTFHVPASFVKKTSEQRIAEMERTIKALADAWFDYCQEVRPDVPVQEIYNVVMLIEEK